MKTEAYRGMTTRQQQILELFKTHGVLVIREIAEKIGLTGMAIRKHVLQLQKKGYVEIAGKRGHAHKPAYMYRLTSASEALFPEQYGELAVELLDHLQELRGEEAVRALFYKQQARLVKECTWHLTGKELEERIEVLTRYLDESGFMARWRKHSSGDYELEETNCPIWQVAVRFRQACQCEAAFLSQVLEAKVERRSCMTEGGRVCLYRIAKHQADGG